ncbi:MULTISPECIES: DUF669 domain-containing protein [Staphylococcus]|jgi:hypothetical protein|uniref:DUF669 domain-containing protein n=1 Tax=Staphylococcus TaxID=1279 RepID=UPI00026BFB93|nr:MULTISPECIES: DUF669 domain-containing protein [Staphylococcus]EJD81844.1 hypothetical protein HMPREF9994_02329 [Staphylococcus epidermidis NIHLM088]EJD88531.1 hypothetical protein HMPREF9992_02192 [Staphylococcus epidermidis NIHLM070]MDU2991353.1 DUF669 domain-containing protein [Streptococcus mitis]DAT89557.1 MAG TPA: Protein of unknown function (DUF669) [Caudoviricetes sp.]EJE23157.1 hypothetical protein HMPREF9976_05946 [Staphylococcus epidermidis NIHLM003]
MKFNLNLQGAQEIGNYMNPGQYSVKIKNFEGKQSKNGHPQFAITFAHKEAGEFVHFANADMTTDYAKNWIYTFLSIAGLQGVNGAFSFTERDLIGKPLNIELKREYNDYTEKWNTVLKRIWRFDGTPIFEQYEIKDDEKSQQKQNKPSVYDSNEVPPLEITDDDLPF